MYWHKNPDWVGTLFPGYLWFFPRSEKTIYLTFDDGPIPEITDWVLAELEKYNAKATFFCVGDNIVKHPEVFKRVYKAGHSIGNHTHNHLNGWKTESEHYITNTQLCQEAIEAAGYQTPVKLFRPPYIKMRREQSNTIVKDYKIVMWDVLTADFDPELKPEVCLKRSIDSTKAGSIVIFHDSVKSWHNLSYVLPRFLEHFSKLGYSFKAISVD